MSELCRGLVEAIILHLRRLRRFTHCRKLLLIGACEDVPSTKRLIV